MKKLTKGFTLIEILVVMGIIAVLAAIVLVAINPARQFAQARQTQRTSNVNAILNAIGQYVADNQGDLPPSIAGLTAGTPADIDNGGTDTLCEELVPEYLNAMLVDPNIVGTSGYDEGEPIEDGDCDAADTWDTGYEVERDATNRVSVCSPESTNEAALPDVTDPICVTR